MKLPPYALVASLAKQLRCTPEDITHLLTLFGRLSGTRSKRPRPCGRCPLRSSVADCDKCNTRLDDILILLMDVADIQSEVKAIKKVRELVKKLGISRVEGSEANG